MFAAKLSDAEGDADLVFYGLGKGEQVAFRRTDPE